MRISKPHPLARRKARDPGPLTGASGHAWLTWQGVRLAVGLVVVTTFAMIGFSSAAGDNALLEAMYTVAMPLMGAIGLLLVTRAAQGQQAPSAMRWSARILAVVAGVLVVGTSLADAHAGIAWWKFPPWWWQPILVLEGIAALCVLGQLWGLLRPGRGMRWPIVLLPLEGLLLGAGILALRLAPDFSLLEPLALVTSLAGAVVFVGGTVLGGIALLNLVFRVLRTVPPDTVPPGLVQAAERAGISVSSTEGLPDGARILGEVDEWEAELRLATDRAPMQAELRVAVPHLPEALRIERRDGPSGVSTGDALLDRLVAVRGVEETEARRRLAEHHEAVLPVVQGHLRSGVWEGRVRIRLEAPGKTGANDVDSEAMAGPLAEAVEEAVELARALAGSG